MDYKKTHIEKSNWNMLFHVRKTTEKISNTAYFLFSALQFYNWNK